MNDTIYECDECAVCFEKFDKCNVCTTSCGHKFHTTCIYKCLALGHECPICKQNIVNEEEIPQQRIGLNVSENTPIKLTCMVAAITVGGLMLTPIMIASVPFVKAYFYASKIISDRKRLQRQQNLLHRQELKQELQELLENSQSVQELEQQIFEEKMNNVISQTNSSTI